MIDATEVKIQAQEFVYWRVRRPSERFVMMLGRRLPLALRRAVLVDATVRASCKRHNERPEGSTGYDGPDGLDYAKIHDALDYNEGFDKRHADTVEWEPPTGLREDAEASEIEPGGQSAGEYLATLGTDGAKWATEFAYVLWGLADKTSVTKLLDPMPGEWLHGWFCNAIEAGRSAGFEEGRKEAVEELEGNIKRLSARTLDQAGRIERQAATIRGLRIDAGQRAEEGA